MVKMRQIDNLNVRCCQPRKPGNRRAMLVALSWLGSSFGLLLAAPAQAAWFTDWTRDRKIDNAYRLCGEQLTEAKVEPAMAAKACAEVLNPEYLSRCVLDITAKEVDALMTLEACRRVRRPLELATCVSDIHQQDAEAALPPVLEACRQSLLPERYGKCVVGLNKSLNVSTAAGLSTCIDAGDRPKDMLSSFKPLNQLPRLSGFGAAGAAEDGVTQFNSAPATTPSGVGLPSGVPQRY